jgi:plasmid stabilization system protein ParE
MAPDNVDFHPSALQEADAAVRGYARKSRAAARAFVEELERAIAAISDSPDRWPSHVHGTP